MQNSALFVLFDNLCVADEVTGRARCAFRGIAARISLAHEEQDAIIAIDAELVTVLFVLRNGEVLAFEQLIFNIVQSFL